MTFMTDAQKIKKSLTKLENEIESYDSTSLIELEAYALTAIRLKIQLDSILNRLDDKAESLYQEEDRNL